MPAGHGSDPAFLRHRQIAELVAGGRFQRTQALAERLGVSTVTLRSDLETLEGQGVLTRVRGGAVGREEHQEPTFESAENEVPEAKLAIAQACVALINPGDTVILDVGTTAAAVAAAIAAAPQLRGLTVVTPSLTATFQLRLAEHVDLIVTGGSFRREQHSLVEPLGTLVLDRVHADVAFLGCNGVSADQGVTNVNFPEAQIKLAMLAASQRHVVIADSRKIGQAAAARVCPIDVVDVVVTDAGADAAEIRRLREHDVDVVVAGSQQSSSKS